MAMLCPSPRLCCGGLRLQLLSLNFENTNTSSAEGPKTVSGNDNFFESI